MARHYSIAERSKEFEVSLAKFSDFTLVEDDDFDPALIFDQAGWSPYCFDSETGRVLFVRLPADHDLAKAAFVYVDQFNLSSHAACLSIAEVVGAAKGYAMPDVAMIYSIGRCGTTLANHVLNASPEMTCMSEHCIVDQIATYQGADRAALGQAVAAQIFATRHKKSARVLGLKLRSQMTFHVSALNAAIPAAHSVFLYRDAIGWGNSFYDMLTRFGVEDPYNAETVEFGWPILAQEDASIPLARHADLRTLEIDPGVFWAHLWALHLEAYAALTPDDPKLHPIRYNEFNGNRLEGVRELMSACGVSPDAAEEALRAFEADSQKGTSFSRNEKPPRMSEANKVELRKTLKQHPGFEDPDIILT